MQNPKILSLIGTVMIVTATVCTYAVPRLPVPAIHKIRVETFPRTLGEWTAGPDQAVDPEVQGKIPTATIVCRNYTNKSGDSVELLLLSASQRGDFHDPNLCFPAHGWNLTDHQAIRIKGERFDRMTAVQNNLETEVLYKWMGDANILPPNHLILRSAYTLREELLAHGMMDRQDGMSVFMRVTAPNDDLHQKAITNFTNLITPIVQSLLKHDGT